MGETRVVERAAVLGHPHGATAEVGDEPLGELALGVPGGDAEDAAREAGQVDLGAGEGHRRVQRDHARTDGGGRLEDGEAVATGGVGDVLALADRAGRAEHRDHVGEHVVGDGEQQEVAGPGDVGGLREGYAGQQCRAALAGGVGLAGDGDDLVARAAEGGGQGRADATGADGADPQARAGLGHLVRTSRFSPAAPRWGRLGTARCARDCDESTPGETAV